MLIVSVHRHSTTNGWENGSAVVEALEKIEWDPSHKQSHFACQFLASADLIYSATKITNMLKCVRKYGESET